MSSLEHRLYYRRHLPHFQPEGATLFVTFRLAGSIPQEVVARLLAEARQTDHALEKIEDVQERTRQADLARRRLFGKWDHALDSNLCGPHWLADRQIAALVADALQHRHKQVYELHAYCIMPNHIHLVCTPLAKACSGYQSLTHILQSLKGYTAHAANLYLQRTGSFWQQESYDHVVRDESELNRIVAYVANNPVKAGLVREWQDWEWTHCRAG